jgi:hypothetical protein
MAEQRAALNLEELIWRWMDELPQGDLISRREELLEAFRAQLEPVVTEDFEVVPRGGRPGA